MLLPEIAIATRNEFRELLCRQFVLREIKDIFTGAGFTDEVTYIAWGDRRKLVGDFYKTVNLARQSDIAMLFSAVNEATARLTAAGDWDRLSDLIRLMKRDGYRYENGAFVPMERENSTTGRTMMWSLSRFSLICYGTSEEPVFRMVTGAGTFPKDRLGEHTNDDLKHIYRNDPSLLTELPALVTAETTPGGDPKTPAFLVQIEDVRVGSSNIRFRFRRIQTAEFSFEEIFGSKLFDIDTKALEHSRTHWAIKEGHLLEGLSRLLADRPSGQAARFPSTAKPRFFRLDKWPLPTLGHVAVMMPFDSAYDPVYKAIRNACRHHNLEAKRVDEILGPSTVMDDVFKTIVQSRFVISDLTKRNPNVLYETGIAHARNRQVVMIVQNKDDIPFDLQHIRFVQYLPNDEGYEQLKADLVNSIKAILGE